MTLGYTIQFGIPEAARVRIAVFDDRARPVKILLDSDEAATLPGYWRTPAVVWDFTDADGAPVKDGDYRLYFKAGDFTSTSDVVVP